MKINRKISFILVALVLLFSLAACGKDKTKKEDSTNTTDQVTPDVPQDEDTESIADNAEPSGLDMGVEADLEIPMDLETDHDPVDEMIDSSDYIAKIKLIKKGEAATELKVLDSIKDTISTSDLPPIDTLELNRAYVVFLKNVDSSVVLTDEANGIILLEGDNHELFEKINQKVHNN